MEFVTITNCQLNPNEVDAHAIYAREFSRIIIDNSYFANNSAYRGTCICAKISDD